MKNIFIGLLIMAGLPCFVSCKKHASYTGIITNGADGLPVKGVEVELRFLTGTKNGTRISDSDHQLTDDKGQYALEVKASRADENGVLIVKEKEGFAAIKPVLIQPGDCEELDFTLHPYDAWLEVTFENTSNRTKKYQYNYSGPFLDGIDYCHSTCGPFTLSPTSKKSEIVKIPGGAEIVVKWDTMSTNNSIKEEKILCNRNDTARLKITLK